ncbi:PD40 domain-containing protein [candidate division WOR-3 bacterium]|nr:PD40 domain-containing protein [candidate division WOR-3 bacterium]
MIVFFLCQTFADPVPCGESIFFTDEKRESLYILSEETEREIFRGSGCGRFVFSSPSGTKIGFKFIDENGMQTPMVYDVYKNEFSELSHPRTVVGQVSFTLDDRPAYTTENELIIDPLGENISVYLGLYANICPISPDGSKAVYNDLNDALWTVNTSSGEKRKITPDGSGFCCPEWSKDGNRLLFTSLEGGIFVWKSLNSAPEFVGEGINPSFSPDGEMVVFEKNFHRSEILVNSDIYLWLSSEKQIFRITNTDSVKESCPVFTGEREIAYLIQEKNSMVFAKIENAQLETIRVEELQIPEKEGIYKPVECHGKGDSLDVPYIHQVYDTPDWFNGHWACAPSTATMAIAYYCLLPSWRCQCSSPYSHESLFGRYICERYMFNETDYNLSANDPAGTPAYGGYGFMWNGTSSPHTTMAQYFLNHGLSSSGDDSPTFSEVVIEIGSGFPHSLCVGLTSSGHLVLAVGQVLTWHTLIFNDPYGDKNTPGYPSYDGKFVRYDWPGYNNGYQNLNQVYWTVTSRGNFPATSDTLVDDRHLSSGFYLNAENPSSMRFWRDALSGFQGHSWWTYSTECSIDTCYATWTPELANPGNYQVAVYIPPTNALASSVRYQIHHSTGVDTVHVDQSQYSDEWISLGSYYFEDAGGYLYLGDATGVQGQRIAFDAAVFSEQISFVEEDESVNPPVVWANFHGDFVVIKCCSAGNQSFPVFIFDLSGRLVFSEEIQLDQSGVTMSQTSGLSDGVYFLKVYNRGVENIIKLLKIK